jgi:hypothetical protein
MTNLEPIPPGPIVLTITFDRDGATLQASHVLTRLRSLHPGDTAVIHYHGACLEIHHRLDEPDEVGHPAGNGHHQQP